MPVLERARDAMRRERAVFLRYADAEGTTTERTIWPVQLGFFDGKEVLVAWCCLHQGYRFFRSDRIVEFDVTETPYGRPRKAMGDEWLAHW